MKELYYQIYFKEREDDLPLTTICLRIPEENVREFVKELRSWFDAGYDPDEVGSRDQWVDDLLDAVTAKYGGLWSYAEMNGFFVVE